MAHNNILKEPKITAWIDTLKAAGCIVRDIAVLSELRRTNGELLFALLDVDASEPDGTKLMPYIFIRGHACIIVPLLKNRDTRDERFLMVLQRRIAHGHQCLEFPAGMLDSNIDNPLGVALRELHEETGLRISENELHRLCEKPLHSSPGACDEAVYYYGCIIELPDSVYRSFEGRLAGSKAENEHIQVTLKTRDEAEKKLMSLQAQLGFFLFEQARKRIEKS